MKGLLLPAIILVFAVSLATIGTYAGFVDTETSRDNVVQAGTVELFLENMAGVGDTWEHSVLRTWHWENLPDPRFMEPGDVLSSDVYLHSFGSSEGDHVDVYCVNVNSEPDDDWPVENEKEDALLGYDVPLDAGFGVYDKDKAMIITHMKYHTTLIVSGEYSFNPAWITDTSGDGRISLDELEAQGLHGLTPVPNSAGIVPFAMTVKFADDDDYNEYQGDATDMTLI
ncbi:MAG: hypothetical protein JSW71_07320, partial [Gemmatimonadota bacterium]